MKRLLTSLLFAAWAATSLTADVLPSPTHQIDFGYWFADGRYGDFTSEVFGRSNLYIAVAGAYDTAQDWRPPFAASMARAAAANKKIYLLIGGPYVPGSCHQVDTAFSPPIDIDPVLDIAAPYWGQVTMLEVAHETTCDADTVDADISLLFSKLDARGLAHRPVGLMQTSGQSTNPNYPARGIPTGRSESRLDWVGIEGYFNVGDSTATIDSFFATAKSVVPSGMDIVLVGQAFDRATSGPSCPSSTDWRCHIPELVALQTRTYLAAYNDPRVIALTMFNYGRQNTAPGIEIGGTRLHYELKWPHKLMGEKLFLPSTSSWGSLPSLCLVSCDGQVDTDHIADLTVYRPSTGTWYTSLSSTAFGSSNSYQWGLSSDEPANADFDGDGKADLVVWRPSTANWYARLSSLNFSLPNALNYTWGATGDIPVPADFDGDGKSDLVAWRPSGASQGTWFVANSSTGFTTSSSMQWGLTGDIPLRGDFDGDGKADFLVFRPGTGDWWVKYSSTGASTTYQHGQSGDIPLAGDFDGDGKSDLVVFRPAEGNWYLRFSGNGYDYANPSTVIQWGLPGDAPVLSDFDNDGKSDLVIYRPSTGVWWIKYSGTGYTTSASYQFGLSTDTPLTRR